MNHPMSFLLCDICCDDWADIINSKEGDPELKLCIDCYEDLR